MGIGETFRGDSSLVIASFKHRADHWYNAVPVSVRTGSLATVKHKLRKWVKQNVPVDWGLLFLANKQYVAASDLPLSIILSTDGTKVTFVNLYSVENILRTIYY